MYGPCCLATGATPGSGSPSLGRRMRGVADHEDVRMPGHR